MPEGDTVYRTAHRLDQALAGQPLVLADLRWPELSTIDLVGRTTLEVVPRGKNILHRLSGGVTVHSHLRMEGQWRIEHTASLTARSLANLQIRALLGAEAYTAVGLRLGDLHAVPTSAEHTLVGHLGPDVLGPGWDPAEAARRLAASPTTIGAALLDQRNLAGVGTMYAAESLFLERLPPWTPAAELAPTAVASLVERAHLLLDRGKEGAVQRTTGRGDRGEWHFVHGRSGRPCLRCGTTVRVAMIGDAPRERTMFYCPSCQGGLGPTDDGRQQRPLGSGTAKPAKTAYRNRR
ncbi:DNA-formamidopyrimidine glycosylase family protein [Lapillicoccus sp.]|uniref:Fpg/Nei family DNA glycosylase n=1 Tax=Lapillicoccus sp. TaxID=1909287 RepID=UPI0025FBE6B9|nr:DNA-formamidopyrimidine glycosylase family protein [Lapillicoccus sp.]